MSRIGERITPGTVLASIAIFLALTGGAYALGKNSVGTKQLKKNAVTAAKIKRNAVKAAKIKKGAVTAAKIKGGAVTAAKIRGGAVTRDKIRSGAVTGDKVDLATLGPVPRVEGRATFPQTRIVATDGPDRNTAREAASEVLMFEIGPVAIYAKCYTDLATTRTYAEVSIKTSVDGVIFESDQNEFSGNPFLGPATPENNRVLMYEDADVDSADAYMMHSDETVAMLPDGTSFQARHSIAVKNGNLPAGNGLYGDGDVCLVAGELTEYR